MLSSINSGSTTATLTVSTSATRDVVDFGNYPPRTTCITDVIVTEASGVKWIEMSIDGDPSHSSVGLFFTGDFNPDLDLFHPNLGPLAYPDKDLDEAPLNYKDFVLMSLGNGRLWGRMMKGHCHFPFCGCPSCSVRTNRVDGDLHFHDWNHAPTAEFGRGCNRFGNHKAPIFKSGDRVGILAKVGSQQGGAFSV